MTENEWTKFILAEGTRPDYEAFGDAGAEAALALAANAGQVTLVAPLLDVGLIRASGEEAAVFLNNLLSNELKQFGAKDARLAGLCTPKGRLLGTFLISRDPAATDDFLLQTSAELLPALLKRLGMFVFRTKVKLSDASTEYVALGLAGKASADLLHSLGIAPPGKMQMSAFDGGYAIGIEENRFVLVLETSAAQNCWRKLRSGATAVGLNAWRALDIAAGLPRVTAATQEMFIPQMLNFELIGGVSFKKGCYPGQEIVARTQHLGKIKRRMFRARLKGEAVPGTDLFAPETGAQSCGNIVLTSALGAQEYECLAVVQSSCREAGEIHLGSPQGPLLDFAELPYPLV